MSFSAFLSIIMFYDFEILVSFLMGDFILVASFCRYFVVQCPCIFFYSFAESERKKINMKIQRKIVHLKWLNSLGILGLICLILKPRDAIFRGHYSIIFCQLLMKGSHDRIMMFFFIFNLFFFWLQFFPCALYVL